MLSKEWLDTLKVHAINLDLAIVQTPEMAPLTKAVLRDMEKSLNKLCGECKAALEASDDT